MKHLYSLGVIIGRAKTRKTLCSVRKPESDLAQGSQLADCPECRAARDREVEGMRQIAAYSKSIGVPTADIDETVRLMDDAANRYRNQEMLR